VFPGCASVAGWWYQANCQSDSGASVDTSVFWTSLSSILFAALRVIARR